MPFDQHVADRLAPIMAAKADMQETRMMGGIVYMCHGNMCVGVYKNFLIIRVGVDAFEELSHQYDELRAMDITGRPMKGWGMIDSDACDEETFSELIDAAEHFVRTLPKKEK